MSVLFIFINLILKFLPVGPVNLNRAFFNGHQNSKLNIKLMYMVYTAMNLEAIDVS